ncbi:MAG TPA: hypothetical protein DCF45_08085 [Gammaproteobacteria bacterium]|nr:hypothetical protein [Gammaproteobacteria bacterium]
MIQIIYRRGSLWASHSSIPLKLAWMPIQVDRFEMETCAELDTQTGFTAELRRSPTKVLQTPARPTQ